RIRTEELFSTQEHDIFFNRGVASSQAYARKFDNKQPDELMPAKRRAEAREWLSRKLDDAILAFINSAAKGDGLLCCFYEFRYDPVHSSQKWALDRGAEVKFKIDAKENGRFDKKKKKKTPPFPRRDNLKMLKTTEFPMDRVILRQARKSNIHHNKFMV